MCRHFYSVFLSLSGFSVTILQSYTYALGGLPVSAVTFGQPAALAGLQKGDVIIGVNGTSLRTIDHSKAIHVLNSAFSSSGSHVALDVVRYKT
jgi:C-terminal processing protease CtpA/Prc